MHKFTNKQIENTIKMIDSLIINCEKIKPKLKEGSPQLSLNKNRVEALNISKILLMNEKNDYKKDELIKASVQITSIINKSKTGISNAKEGSGTYTCFSRLIESMTIALSYIEDAISD